MPRSAILFTGPWTDLPLEEIAGLASEWGYQGLDLATWGDHCEVQRILGEDDHCSARLDLLRQLELELPVISCHRLSQLIADNIDGRHRALVPDYVWGDGKPTGVRERATQEMIATIQAAQKLGASTVAGFTGSPIWSFVGGYPSPSREVVSEGFREVVHHWTPILEVCADLGIRYAFEVHPGQIAFDLVSAEMLLDAMGGREEFGFTFDPTHLFWQGIDPVEFLRRFPDRIYHVHVKDVAITLNGRTGLLGSYLPYADPRRGWSPRCPGRGGLDWEAIIRALNSIGYTGALAVEWSDPGMDRSFGAEEARRFLQRLDFPSPPSPDEPAFR
ncbi:MAG: sugar phosphate isomerase/epimerase family protein [Gemmataceae bacterium]